jgi:hypothetical protein
MVTRCVRKMDCIGAASLIQIIRPNAQTISQANNAAQPRDRTTPREITVSGHSGANRCWITGTEDSLMTPRGVL